jgi:hypothetical protein
MATKKTTTKPEEVLVETIVETIKVTPKVKQEPVNTWEIKDRTYILKGNKEPITYTIQSRHTKKYSLLYFDEKTAEQRELRYATNQSSPFVDEQKGESTLGHIMFTEGVLTVPKNQQSLQKLLSLYHPALNKKYYEFNAIEIATDELDDLEVQLDAMMVAKSMDIDTAEAILRVQLGSKVSNMSSKELRRDLLLFARSYPEMFIELANDDNVQLRNVAIKANEMGIIKLSQDQRSFSWGSNGRKLMNIPFDENPYSAMAAWFKTDEGVEVYRSIEKNLK